MLASAMAGCALRLGAPSVSLGVPEPLPWRVPARDPDRWYVAGEVGGATGWWFVDTGYTNTTCDDGLVADLGLTPRGRGQVRGDHAAVRVGRVALPSFGLGGHTVEGLTCLVRDLETTSSVRDVPEARILGVLGLDVLRAFTVAIDPELGLLLDDSPVDGGVRMRVTRGPSPRAAVRVVVDGRAQWSLLDTGAERTWMDLDRAGLTATGTVSVRVTGTGGSRDATLRQAEVDLSTLGVDVGPVVVLDRREGPLRRDLLGLDGWPDVPCRLDLRRRRAACDPG